VGEDEKGRDMKPTDTRWVVNEDGDIICVFHGDQHRRTIAVRSSDFPLTAYSVAILMNDAFDSGSKAKAQQIRMEIGL
jgi:hypothetical protein